MIFDPTKLHEAFDVLDEMSRTARREAVANVAFELDCPVEDLAVIVARPGSSFGIALSLAVHDGTDLLLDEAGKAQPHIAAMPRDAAMRLLAVEFPELVEAVRSTPPGTVCCVLVLDDHLGRAVFDDVGLDEADDEDDVFVSSGPGDPFNEIYQPSAYAYLDDEPDDPEVE